ncbi:hypothetical protein CQY20_01960 [Mycolicibacterium agri]|uniref:Uncharacterized protein n=1 Tax=Mycolicibacterium agri TaxID=36811 RepID=A0A2A7NG38_MYCAG|nr:hypothetical protein [Mycolicibacterium agri]PEG42776.1 hypothetical protein CQY20_01960 [Mycolicibacterium agri]GFG52771.1 hypothetical protein MAGR_42120 [Mycolicibacterium agri]
MADAIKIKTVLAVGILVLAVVISGAGTPVARADTPPAQLKSATVKGTTLTYTFSLQSNDNVGGIWLTVRERDNPDRVIIDGRDVNIHPLPPPFRDITRTAEGMPENTPVCVSIVVWEYVHLGFNEDPSPPSNTICTDPAKTAAQADVALQTIRGNDSPPASASPAYLVIVRNVSDVDATGVVVDISTSGVAKLGDQSVVTPGWTANGFSCAPVAPVGGQSSAMRCTGGTVAKGKEINPAVIVTFDRPGIGAIHAQVSGAGDTTPGNNGTALPLTPR